MSLTYFRRHPEAFWEAYKEIFGIARAGEFQPNSGHLFLSSLEKRGKDITIITQNVDALHTKAGSTKVLEMHGSLHKATCPACGTVYDLDKVMSDDVPRCERAFGVGQLCGAVLKPNIVLFEDAVHCLAEAFEAVLACDLFLTMGSSLKVGPANQLPAVARYEGRPTQHSAGTNRDKKREAGERTLCMINNEPTDMDGLFDWIVHEPIGLFCKHSSEFMK